MQNLMEVVQNLEVAKPDWTPSENSDLTLALQGDKVKDCAADDYEALRKVLRMIMLKLGLRSHNIPKGEEKLALMNHIVFHYGNHTLYELRLAFEMALAGKLPIDAKEVTCYENFSCAYFSKIMNAYREWAAAEYKRVERFALPEKADSTDEWMNDSFQHVVLGVIAGHLRAWDIQPVFYDWLLESGKVQDAAALYKDISIQIGKEIGDRGDIGEYRAYKKMWLAGEIEQPYADQIVLRAKQTTVKDYILKILATVPRETEDNTE